MDFHALWQLVARERGLGSCSHMSLEGADMLIIDGDPIKDLLYPKDKNNIPAIMKNGELYKYALVRKSQSRSYQREKS